MGAQSLAEEEQKNDRQRRQKRLSTGVIAYITNMNDTISYMIMLLFSSAVAVVVTTMTTTAYAETAILTGIPKEISDALVTQTINRIENYANNTSYVNAPLIGLTDEGVITIVYNNNTLTDSSDDISIIAPHDYTSENGYIFRDNQIFKPDGSPLFE